ncbi:MAG: SDR family NAD(P)-dependent oxidoreductase, partial [Sphingomonadales bacterium]|nr:SDR family NAD(P)-dependent oxidoreductase [Sphingomonadales bacterium]
MDRLANKVAIVFGAGPNIGGTIAHFMAREGARVVVSDVSLEAATETVEFIRSKGYVAHATHGNATIEAD